MIWVVHPGSGSWSFTHPGSRGQKGTGSRIRIRNTAPLASDGRISAQSLATKIPWLAFINPTNERSSFLCNPVLLKHSLARILDFSTRKIRFFMNTVWRYILKQNVCKLQCVNVRERVKHLRAELQQITVDQHYEELMSTMFQHKTNNLVISHYAQWSLLSRMRRHKVR